MQPLLSFEQYEVIFLNKMEKMVVKIYVLLLTHILPSFALVSLFSCFLKVEKKENGRRKRE